MNIEKLSEKVAGIDERCKNNTQRINEICDNQKAIMSLATSVSSMLKTQEYMSEDIKGTADDVKLIKQCIQGFTPQSDHDKLEEEIKVLQQKPAKRWEELMDRVIWAIAAGLITFFLTCGGFSL